MLKEIIVLLALCLFLFVPLEALCEEKFIYPKDDSVNISTLKKMYEQQLDNVRNSYENKLSKEKQEHSQEKQKIIAEQEKEFNELKKELIEIKKREISHQNILYNPSDIEIVASFDDKVLIRHFSDEAERQILLSLGDVFLYSGMPFELFQIKKREKIIFNLLEGYIDGPDLKIDYAKKLTSDMFNENVEIVPRLVIFFNGIDGDISFAKQEGPLNDIENLGDMKNDLMSTGDDVDFQELYNLIKDGQVE